MTTMSQRALIVRIRNWVGDVVLGLPALRHCRHRTSTCAASHKLALVLSAP
jgi:hypothetical protein